MKKIILFFFLILASLQTKAQMTTTVLYESPDSQINVYIVSQGFTSASMTTFNNFTDGFLAYLWTITPYTQNQTRFRIIRVNLPGTTENQPAAYFQFENVDPNALPAYISGGLSNPLYTQYQSNECYANFRTRMNNLKPQLPGFNSKSYIIGIFNNNYYTGGGGEYTFATIFGNAPSYSGTMFQVLVHEFSHTFGLLADEYPRTSSTPYQKDPLTCAVLTSGGNPLVIDPTTYPLFQDRNVTTDKLTLATIPWSYLVTGSSVPTCGYNAVCPGIGIGLYEGANYSSNGPGDIKAYRSDQACCMRNIGSPFCQVCRDLITERIQEHLCYATNTVAESFVSRHQYITHWRKASSSLTSSSAIGNKISVDYVSGNSITLTAGFNAVVGSDFYAHIGNCDNIQLINQYKVTGGSSPTSSQPKQMSSAEPIMDGIKMSPNPATDLVTITSNNAVIKNIALFTIDGKCIYNQKANGNSVSLNTTGFAKGTYIINIEDAEGKTTSKKFIKE